MLRVLRSICAPRTGSQFWIRVKPGTKVGTRRPSGPMNGVEPFMTGSDRNTNPVEDWELPPVRHEVNCSPPSFRSWRPKRGVDTKYDTAPLYWRLLRSSGSLESK